MKNKRGQVTIFIIVAILVIGAVALFLTLKGTFQREKIYAPEVASVKNYIDTCLEDSLKRVVFINALQGGYYTLSQNYLVHTDENLYFESKIPYYLINNQSLIPIKKDLEKQISLGIENEFQSCLDLYDLPYSIDYNYENVKVSSSINEGIIKSDVKLSVVVTYGDSSATLENFDSEFETNYFFLYELANELTEEQSRDIQNICVTCNIESVEESGYNISSRELISDESYILINTILDYEEGPVFSFAYKFTQEEL